MTTIQRNAYSPYSAEEMFHLVNDVESYSQFLPWCESSQIINQDEAQVTATLDLMWKGVRKSFTTKNFLQPFQSIRMTLVEGPMRHLDGRWEFHALDQGCKVELNMEFEFSGSWMDRMLEPIFSGLSNSLVDAFCKRADQVYGKN